MGGSGAGGGKERGPTAGHVQGLASGSPVTIKFKEPVSVRAVRVVARGETPHQERLPDFTGYVEALLLCP